MPLSKRRRRMPLGLTPLIDVIFLLLLFFMLSSTFSKFSEIELRTGGGGLAPAPAADLQRLFLRLTADGLSLNGRNVESDELAMEITEGDGPKHVILSVADGAQAQALADVMVALGGVPNADLTVIGGN